MILELCANSLQSAKIAQDLQLNRIELCENLSVGGVTPSKKLIKKVVEELKIPVHILIRPRSGDFVYNTEELNQMIDSIQYCNKIGCAGVVSGVLTSDHKIDFEKSKVLIQAAKGMEFTFHRAFDVCENALKEFEKLQKLQITRLLTSGQKPTALEGLSILKKIFNITQDIEIMPGGGITSQNALTFKKEGFKSIHFSAIKKDCAINTLFNNKVEGFSNPEEVFKIKKLFT